MANYLTVGYMEDGLIAELSPKRRVRVLEAATGTVLSAEDARAKKIVDIAVSHYQLAADVLRNKDTASKLVVN
jgi:hypothetical protein